MLIGTKIAVKATKSYRKFYLSLNIDMKQLLMLCEIISVFGQRQKVIALYGSYTYYKILVLELKLFDVSHSHTTTTIPFYRYLWHSGPLQNLFAAVSEPLIIMLITLHLYIKYVSSINKLKPSPVTIKPDLVNTKSHYRILLCDFLSLRLIVWSSSAQSTYISTNLK